MTDQEQVLKFARAFFEACSSEGTYFGMEEIYKEAEAIVQSHCAHEWRRRRDGRMCHKCGIVQFGVLP